MKRLSRSEVKGQGDSGTKCTWMVNSTIGVDLTGILGRTDGGTYYKNPAVEAKNTFPYTTLSCK